MRIFFEQQKAFLIKNVLDFLFFTLISSSSHFYTTTYRKNDSGCTERGENTGFEISGGGGALIQPKDL